MLLYGYVHIYHLKCTVCKVYDRLFRCNIAKNVRLLLSISGLKINCPGYSYNPRSVFTNTCSVNSEDISTSFVSSNCGSLGEVCQEKGCSIAYKVCYFFCYLNLWPSIKIDVLLWDVQWFYTPMKLTGVCIREVMHGPLSNAINLPQNHRVLRIWRHIVIDEFDIIIISSSCRFYFKTHLRPRRSSNFQWVLFKLYY